jgi:hypothetical protein
LGVAFGLDDNLLGAPSHTGFELTLPSGRLPVTLAPDQRPRSGSFVRFDLDQQGGLPLPLGRWRYALAASWRQTVNYSPADQWQLGGLLEFRPENMAGPYLLGVYQHLNRGGDTLLQQRQFGLGWEFSHPQPCQFRLGGEIQWLAYPANPDLDGVYQGLMTQWACPVWDLQVQLRVGQDTPQSERRPGGLQHQHALRVLKSQPLFANHLALEFEWYRQADNTGYSSLLESNAARRLDRRVYRAEYRWLGQAYNPYIGIEWLDQQSNLPLFALANRVITVGVRLPW